MAFPTKFKPETIERHRRERAAEYAANIRDLHKRLQQAVEKYADDPDYQQMWIEMLAEHEARHPELVA